MTSLTALTVSSVVEAARADVLVEDVPSRLCLGKSLTVGVWYQAYSGGPRGFSIEIYNPDRRLVFYRRGLASAARWKSWRYRPTGCGPYRVIYTGAGIGRWSRPVQVGRCSN